MPVAFFDLDKTLLATNSGKLWVRRELALGHISRLQAFSATVWIAQYHLGLTAGEAAVERAISMLAGFHESALQERTEAFYLDTVRHLYRPGALAALKHHRDRGDRLVLLTSSSQYLADRVMEELKLDASLCNRFEVDAAGVFTGRVIGSVCFGVGKLLHAKAYVEAQGERLEEATFYTDSYSDLSVLLRVGHPVAINPDQRLRRLAFRRGWRIEDWGGAAQAQAALT